MISNSAEETFEFARHFAERLERPAVILLSGDLGAGKTVFAKGIAAAMGIDPREVTSPTFTLVNTHRVGGRTLHHVDLYRLNSVSSSDLGLEEMFDEPGAVTIVEWAERLADAPSGSIRVKIDYLSDSQRGIDIERWSALST